MDQEKPLFPTTDTTTTSTSDSFQLGGLVGASSPSLEKTAKETDTMDTFSPLPNRETFPSTQESLECLKLLSRMSPSHIPQKPLEPTTPRNLLKTLSRSSVMQEHAAMGGWTPARRAAVEGKKVTSLRPLFDAGLKQRVKAVLDEGKDVIENNNNDPNPTIECHQNNSNTMASTDLLLHNPVTEGGTKEQGDTQDVAQDSFDDEELDRVLQQELENSSSLPSIDEQPDRSLDSIPPLANDSFMPPPADVSWVSQISVDDQWIPPVDQDMNVSMIEQQAHFAEQLLQQSPPPILQDHWLNHYQDEWSDLVYQQLHSRIRYLKSHVNHQSVPVQTEPMVDSRRTGGFVWLMASILVLFAVLYYTVMQHETISVIVPI